MGFVYKHISQSFLFVCLFVCLHVQFYKRFFQHLEAFEWIRDLISGRIARFLRKIDIRFLTACAHIESLSSLSQYGLGC